MITRMEQQRRCRSGPRQQRSLSMGRGPETQRLGNERNCQRGADHHARKRQTTVSGRRRGREPKRPSRFASPAPVRSRLMTLWRHGAPRCPSASRRAASRDGTCALPGLCVLGNWFSHAVGSKAVGDDPSPEVEAYVQLETRARFLLAALLRTW